MNDMGGELDRQMPRVSITPAVSIRLYNGGPASADLGQKTSLVIGRAATLVGSVAISQKVVNLKNESVLARLKIRA